MTMNKSVLFLVSTAILLSGLFVTGFVGAHGGATGVVKERMELIHQYVDFHEFHKDKDAVMLGVSLDGRNREAAQEFIRRHQVSYPNLINELSNGT